MTREMLTREVPLTKLVLRFGMPKVGIREVDACNDTVEVIVAVETEQNQANDDECLKRRTRIHNLGLLGRQNIHTSIAVTHHSSGFLRVAKITFPP